MKKQKIPNKKVIALAGNPNVGKSTVFNALTGMHQHTGNWTGKTVDSAEGRFLYKEREYVLVDLPGTYSLCSHSEEEGADDYLPKPFHTAELLARIKSVTRRSNGSGRNGIVYGNVKLNPDSRTVEVCGKALTLVKKEYDILHYFLLRPGHMVDKSVLAEAVWGDDIYLADNFDFIYSQVKNLRKKLEEAGADIEIKSVYGFGYKLVTKE